MCQRKLGAKEESKGYSIEQANVVVNENSSDEDDPCSTSRVSSGTSKPFMVEVVINGKETRMELETGASVSHMGEEMFRQIQESDSSL